MKYYREAQGKWLYLPYGSDDIDKLWRKYEVRTMPTLIIVRANGEVITRNGVSHLKKRTPPREMLRQWKSGEIVEKSRKCSIM
ncbi:Nucleoredoxin-like protein 2 [Toxocara canis]|uniref:Nucleoredoxin-like protein 2 n=1 Tax=Toxocara canis TaxID=6265 RepID=A0A0B2V0J1_TOXCA|nr:Nucleoredoxin-like protein 2 [Toxocara canis]